MPALSAVAHTDIQGSTRLWEKLGPAFAPLLAEHNRILREAAAGGRELATEGDSFTFAFGSASDAVRFALRAQEAMHAHGWPAECGELMVRIGVHLEEPGPGARARLVAGAAHGGQVLVTAAARAEAGDALAGASVADLGEHRLAAHDRPERLFQVLPPSVSSRTFPPPRTLSSRPTNVPDEVNSFVGRARELEELSSLIPSPAGRLVTLTGPGGIGKSRLARELAARLLPSFEGGCWFADLLEARSAADVSRAAALALGVPLPAGDDPASAVADALEFRKPLLLVLDGFEALVDHAAATVGLWVRRARHVRVLVTSITLLGLSGEREFALGPLPPQDASRLFLDRAARAKPGFGLTAENSGAVSRICADLEGIPLALELAAARMAELAPADMLRELDNQVHLRGPSPAGRSPRQSLAGALEWSYGLLTAWQRSAFHQACAFRGGFFLESAEEVIDLASEPDAPLAIDAVQALRDRSLLRTTDTRFGTRFSFFRAIREFGERRFREVAGDGAWRAVEDRHARHFLEQGKRLLAIPPTGEVMDRFELELDNWFAIHDRFLARAGTERSAAMTAAQVCLALDMFLALRGPMDQRLARLEALRGKLSADAGIEAEVEVALAEAFLGAGRLSDAAAAAARAQAAAERSGAPRTVARAMLAAAKLETSGGDLAAGVARVAEARALLREAGDTMGESRALDLSSQMERSRGRYAEAKLMMEESLALARSLRDDVAVARALSNLGTLLYTMGDCRGAFAAFDEAEARMGVVGSRLNLAKLQGMRASVHLELGELDRAADLVQQAIDVHREMGLKPSLGVHLTTLGRIRRAQRRHEEAAAIYEETARLARESGDPSAILLADGNIATIRYDAGDREAALALFRSTAEEARRMGLVNSHALNLGNAGMALIDLGRHAEAREALRQAVDVWRRAGTLRTLRAFNVMHALFVAENSLGDAAAARAAAREAAAVAGTLGLEGGKDLTAARQARELRDYLARA
ncbi:MAG: tetratricopeptide repeat protein [Planctomycetia bacterium]|nr:tetratricopeptide repeat protein [Planctomycetia bacterium]